MNLASRFAASTQKHMEKAALFWGDRAYSYSELWSQTLFVTGILRQQYGIGPGDRVALWMKNCPEFVPSLFGVLHTGAVVVPINNFLKPDEVSYILNDAGADLIITDHDLSTHFERLRTARATLELVNAEQVLSTFPVARPA